ncbi:MAG: DEAD/DEAH box helicase family protein [Nitrospirae bacterium]|nr:DEAD/DEAH box helicase family protein [Nitrospirota bacterium]MCX7020640.1 DEAD/DEAH box helicase family protein [Candidatus Sumerlaeota bacterium]
MIALNELSLRPSYHKGQHDIAQDFYVPCMACASRYDRAVGFFTSTIYTIAWSALRQFVEHDGKMRIICSPILTADDIKAIGDGYSARLDAACAEQMLTEVRQLLASDDMRKPARVLASLVAIGVIEFRVAFMDTGGDLSRYRLFHDKVGIFCDTTGNNVAFKGSMNETYAGLSNDGNLESVDVFVSWEGQRELERISEEISYFDSLWGNDYQGVQVKSFPDTALSELIDASDTKNWPQLVDEICRDIEQAQKISADRRVGGRQPRPHQLAALQAWKEQGRRGILEHATGSGKTFTALCAIREALEAGENILIVVPSELLLTQWSKEVSETLADMDPNVLLAGGGNNEWREDKLLGPFTGKRSEGMPRLVIATMQTAASDQFRGAVRGGEHLFLVADEVHRLGSGYHQNILSIDSGPRLGLSATPVRAGDPGGTAALLSYFHGVVPPPFTLADAVKAGTLTPYFYHVHPVVLTRDEQDAWNDLSKEISQLYAQAAFAKAENPHLHDRIKNLLIRRARITKAAAGKVPLSLKVLQDFYRSSQQWIVYCDTQTQLTDVLDLLRQHDLPAGEYHSAMAGDRKQTLGLFEANGGIIVSIRCLDEGVDIPSVSHALILASSKNPREFIQRRGRVLRRSPGKALAHIHDAIVVPLLSATDSDGDPVPGLRILESEMARAIEFGKNARNPSSVRELEIIAMKSGLDISGIVEDGREDEEDEE